MNPKYNVLMSLMLGAPIDSMTETIGRCCVLGAEENTYFIEHFVTKAKPLVRSGTTTLVKLDKDEHQWKNPDDYRQYLDSQGLRPLDAYELLCFLYIEIVLNEHLLVISEKPIPKMSWYAHLGRLLKFVPGDTMNPDLAPYPISFICAVK